VPGREQYEDWTDLKGFGLVGEASFFPHMGDQWQELVDAKLLERGDKRSVYCLRDDQVCCIEGKKRQIDVISSCAVLAR